MRFVRMLFLALVAIALVIIALANRQMVVVRPVPAGLEGWIGGPWQASMPLFLLIFLAMAIGMVLGLLWEWLRESQLRSESARRARDIAALEREVGEVRVRTAQPRDEVLAILDQGNARR